MVIFFCLLPQDRGSELLFNLFLVFESGSAAHIFFLEFSKDGPANFYIWEFCQSASDTARMCTLLLLPAVSVLLPVSIQLLRVSSICDFLLDLVVDAFLNEPKNYSWHPNILSGNLGYQYVLSRQGGSYRILFLVFEGCMT